MSSCSKAGYMCAFAYASRHSEKKPFNLSWTILYPLILYYCGFLGGLDRAAVPNLFCLLMTVNFICHIDQAKGGTELVIFSEECLGMYL